MNPKKENIKTKTKNQKQLFQN